MTATTADEVALCAAIREQPEEDTPRLMYADLLDGEPVDVPCPAGCVNGDDGNGMVVEEPVSWLGNRGFRLASPCVRCAGAGTVRDASRPLRAELCRVQVELARAHGECSRIGGVTVQSGEYLEALARWDKLRARNAELTARLARDHPELYPKCPACKGCYSARGESVANCATCEQVGRVGSWSRGLLSVPVPTLGAVWEWIRPAHNAGTGTGMSKPKGGWQLTPWARGELLTRPWVCEVPVADREPCPGVRYSAGWFGWCEDTPNDSGFQPARIPTPVFRLMTHEVGTGKGCWRWYKTPAAAKLALARAVARAAFAPLKETHDG